LVRIPFNKPTFVQEEIELISEAVRNASSLEEAHFTKVCCSELSKSLNTSYVTLTTSCTHALELAALVLRISPGDEVIVPSYTFTSTANAFVLRGAKVVFADIRDDTLNLDPDHVEQLVTPRTRAIVAMHYAGIACDMDRLRAIASSARAYLVEDAAHAVWGSHRGRPLGTVGDIGAFSFHRTKNFSCGEGGAFVTNDAALAEAAEIAREKGTNRSQFMRGLVHKYEWVEAGSSYIMADLLAAQLLAQLRHARDIQSKRRHIWMRYQSELKDWARHEGIQLPVVPEYCDPAWHLYHLVLGSEEDRDAMLDHLRSRGVAAAFHYLPLHLTPMGRRLGGRAGDAPVVERTASRLVRLPFFTDLTDSEIDRVLDTVVRFRSSGSRPSKAVSRGCR
jgi:dTDP-4-amino-4,6-dideoxygalactose transaminase